MRSKKGFTLVELLVVILILGVLAAIAVPKFTQSADTARVDGCGSNIYIINSQIEFYAAENDGNYPKNLETITNSKTFFPDGPPKCPFTDTNYPSVLVNNRVDDSTHHHQK
jgi:prepilin-type N-terminal cleavage/methylation domain-containing protein